VEGGDDTSMPWRKVEVVEPPAVESLDIRLIPPAYSGCRPQRSDRHIVALVGTRMEMSGRATGPIASATLCFEDGRRFPGSLDSDGCGFRLPAGGESVLVEKSETYWLELTDREGIRGGEDRWGIDAVPDLPPTVAIQQPTANIAVTSRAVAAVRVAAWDDLALKRVEIVFRRSPSASEERLPLYVGPETAPARTSIPTASSNGASGQARDGRRVLQHRWELESLNLQPGSQISYWATATDYHLQTAKSDTRQLTILSLQEFEERVAAREKIIAAERERALKMQRACRAQADALVAQLAAERPMEAIDVDRVRSLQMVQRDASSVLTSSGEGLPMHVRGLLVDLENNRVDLGDTLNRLQTLSHDLDRIAAEMLTPIAQELTLATKTIQIDLEGRDKSLSPDSEVVALLRRVGGRQDSVIAALAQLLEPLTRWEDYRRFDGEWANLVREQEKLAGQTVDLGRRTLTRDRQDLPAQEANDLEKAASRQIELAQTLARLLQGMEKASHAMPTNDPLAASVADAVSTAERLGLEERMRASAAQLGQNQMGQAIAGQRRIVADLQDVADRLAGGARKRSGRMDETLKALQRRQQELLTETKRLRGVEQSATGLGRAELLAIRELTRQQQALGADTAQFSASVPDSDNLRSILGIAGQSMQKAESLLAKRNVGDATAEAETDALRQLAAVADLMAELARRSDAAARSAKPGEAEVRHRRRGNKAETNALNNRPISKRPKRMKNATARHRLRRRASRFRRTAVARDASPSGRQCRIGCGGSGANCPNTRDNRCCNRQPNRRRRSMKKPSRSTSAG
jgi:hypothetical protein